MIGCARRAVRMKDLPIPDGPWISILAAVGMGMGMGMGVMGVAGATGVMGVGVGSSSIAFIRVRMSEMRLVMYSSRP